MKTPHTTLQISNRTPNHPSSCHGYVLAGNISSYLKPRSRLPLRQALFLLVRCVQYMVMDRPHSLFYCQTKDKSLADKLSASGRAKSRVVTFERKGEWSMVRVHIGRALIRHGDAETGRGDEKRSVPKGAREWEREIWSGNTGKGGTDEIPRKVAKQER